MTNIDDLEKAKKLLLELKNAANLPLLSNQEEQAQVRLLTDDTVAPAKFKPHPSMPNTYFASILTIRAVKKDLFMAGSGFEDLEQLTICCSCGQKLDKQFWSFCPYCEGKLLK